MVPSVLVRSGESAAASAIGPRSDSDFRGCGVVHYGGGRLRQFSNLSLEIFADPSFDFRPPLLRELPILSDGFSQSVRRRLLEDEFRSQPRTGPDG